MQDSATNSAQQENNEKEGSGNVKKDHNLELIEEEISDQEIWDQ